MEVESDEEDEKQEKTDEPPAQLDQDTQVQDMDEVRRSSRSLCAFWCLSFSPQGLPQFVEEIRLPF